MSALTLKIVACISMFLDHIGYFWGIEPLRIVGRLAFPIFVYLIYNGYRHTSSKGKYALRLAVFAIGTQIPFNLFCYGTLWYNNGNVFFTLLAALLCLWSVDAMSRHKLLRWTCLLPSLIVCALYHAGIFVSDYGARGVLVILVFYFCDRKGIVWKILTIAGFLCAIYYDYLLSCGKTVAMLLIGAGRAFPVLGSWRVIQAYSVLALPLIFTYNGKKGKIFGKTGGKALQYGFYLFYPLHMLVLYLLSYIL